MASILTLVLGLVGLVAFALQIIFLIQLHKAKGVGHAIAGFCCGLYTLIWGWQNAEQLDASNPPVAGMKYAQLIRIFAAAFAAIIVLEVLINVVARM